MMHPALDEDVDIIALSDHTGSMPIIAESVLKALKVKDAMDINVVAGGLILPSDVFQINKNIAPLVKTMADRVLAGKLSPMDAAGEIVDKSKVCTGFTESYARGKKELSNF